MLQRVQADPRIARRDSGHRFGSARRHTIAFVLGIHGLVLSQWPRLART